MVHRDMRSVSERLAPQGVCLGAVRRARKPPALTIAERARLTTASPDIERAQREEAGRCPPLG
jgi:hypothetical protein